MMKQISVWIGLCIAPVIYYYYLACYAIDIPNADDFVVIMNYLLQSDAATTWQVKWHELAFEFLEHRLVYTRLVAQILRGLQGHLDLRWVMFVGNLSLVGVAGLLYKLLRSNGYSTWYLLPVILCLFQPIAYESHFWAISSTNYMPVCLFAMLSFYGIDTDTPLSLTGAWLMAVIATYTFANGLIVWPIGILILLLKQRWPLVTLWGVSMLFIIWAYYYNHNYHLQPSMADNVRERFLMVIANFFLLLGAAFNTQDSWHQFNKFDIPALIAGVGIAITLAATGVLLASKKWLPAKSSIISRLNHVQKSEFLWASMLFILLSCAAFGAGRSGDGSVASDSRYRDFPVFALSFFYCSLLLVLTPTLKRTWFIVASVGSLFFCVSSYALYTPRLIEQNARHIAGAYNWHHNRDWLIYHETAYFGPVADSVSVHLEKEGTSWYTIRNYFTNPPRQLTLENCAPTTVDTVQQAAYWRLPTDPVGANQPYFWLQTDSHVYLLPILRPTSLRNWLRTGRSVGHSFVVDFNYGRKLFPGRYTVSLFLSPANQQLRFSPSLDLDVRSMSPL